MIKVTKINQLPNVDTICVPSYDVYFLGQIVDDRTREIDGGISSLPNRNVKYVSFDENNLILNIGDEKIRLLHLKKYFDENNYKQVFIDSTSLDFPELLYILHGINQSANAITISVSYVEPIDYTKKESNFAEEDEFEISDNLNNFSALPLFGINNSSSEKSALIATLGFESNRLGQVLGEDDGASYEELHAMVGLPAYKPGWENRSINKHLNYLSQIETTLSPYPSCNPYAINKKISEYYKSYNKMVFAALGTKPSLLGIAIFLVNNITKNTRNKQIGAVYDFPTKAKECSIGVGKVYAFNLEKLKYDF